MRVAQERWGLRRCRQRRRLGEGCPRERTRCARDRVGTRDAAKPTELEPTMGTATLRPGKEMTGALEVELRLVIVAVALAEPSLANSL